MKIGIDGKVLTPLAGGIGRYATNLLRSMLKLEKSPCGALEYLIFTGPQTSRPVFSSLGERAAERFSPLKSSVLRALWTFPRAVAKNGIDLFHGLDHVGIPLFTTRARRVVTLHDIIPCDHPEWFTRKHRLVIKAALGQVARHADRVIVPSVAVKQELLQKGLITEERLRVIPEGCEARFNPEASREELSTLTVKYSLPAEYILFVGNLDPRKNLAMLLRAFARLERQDMRLVVAGSPGLRSGTLIDLVSALRLQQRVHFTGFVDDRDLPGLYRGARLFVFPSLQEGFGLPVLEALRCGTPVVAADSSSIPEVAGAAALLVDPRSEEALAEGMRRVLDDATLAGRLRREGIAHAQKFTWEQTARMTLELYAELLG